MGKKKITDRMALINAAARAEGLSYGQWMAKHPEGLPRDFEAEEPEEIETPRRPAPPKEKHRQPTKRLDQFIHCARCGKLFKPKAPNAKYCDQDCARKTHKEQEALRRPNRIPDKMK